MYDKKLAKREAEMQEERKLVVEALAIRLHTIERSLLKVVNEVSPCNCAWEELGDGWQNYYKLQASFFVSDLIDLGYSIIRSG